VRHTKSHSTLETWIFHGSEPLPCSFHPSYGRQIPGQGRNLFACLSYFWDQGTKMPSKNSHLKVLILQRGDIARPSWRVFVVLASLLLQSPARRQWLRHALQNEFLFVPICSQDGQRANHTITDSLPCRLAHDRQQPMSTGSLLRWWNRTGPRIYHFHCFRHADKVVLKLVRPILSTADNGAVNSEVRQNTIGLAAVLLMCH
jgi:hypothetical protein